MCARITMPLAEIAWIVQLKKKNKQSNINRLRIKRGIWQQIQHSCLTVYGQENIAKFLSRVNFLRNWIRFLLFWSDEFVLTSIYDLSFILF